jgi:hypothetical protein
MSNKKLVGVVRAGVAGEIEHIRNQRGLTLDVVCTRMKWQQSKLSRMENGQQCISQADLASVLVIYKVTDQERQLLLGMTERQDDPGYWEHHTPQTVQSRTLVRLESDAVAIVDVEPLLIPELAQTAEYAHAVLRIHDVPRDLAELRVQARLARRSVLAKADAPKYTMILDERVLRRVVGDHAVMAGQLRAMLELADRPGMRLWVVPAEAGGNGGLDRSFRTMDFRRDQSVVYLEQETSALFLEHRTMTEPFQRRASRLATIALDPKESVHLVARIVKEYE